MSTFYGYAERQAEDSVDWSVIGKEITTMLQDEATRRETLKTDLDNASRKYGETLANAPTGQHEGASSGVLEFASNAEQARLIQDRLLKSGQLKVKDYLKQRQNLTDGTTGLFAAAKEFQAAFESKASRMNDDESMALEFELFKLTEGFGNWNNVGAYINPTNYEVSMGKKKRVMGKDGKYVYEMGDRPEEFFTVAELRNFISLKLDRYDVKAALDKHAASLAPMTSQIVVETPDGYKTIKISDATGTTFDQLDDDQKKVVNDFIKAEEDMIKEMMSNMYNNTSILTDYIGGYSFTWDPDEAGDKKILLEKDPQNKIPIPKFDPKQEKAIEEALRRGIRQRIDKTYSETFVQKRETSAQNRMLSIQQAGLKNTAESYARLWSIIGSSLSSQEEVDAAINTMIAKNPIDENGNKLVQMERDPSTNQMILYQETADGTKFDTPVNLTNAKTYMSALRTWMPKEVSESITESKLFSKGRSFWGAKEFDANSFNTLESAGGRGRGTDFGSVIVAVDQDAGTMTTADQKYSAMNSGETVENINKNGLKQINAYNSKRRGKDKVNISLSTVEDRFVFGTPRTSAGQFQIENVNDAAGMANVYRDVLSLAVGLDSGAVKDAEGHLVSILSQLKGAIANSGPKVLGGWDEDNKGVVIMGTTKYSMKDFQDLNGQIDRNSDAFKELLKKIKIIGNAQGEETTTIDETADAEVDRPKSKFEIWQESNPGGTYAQFEQQNLGN